MIRLTALLRRNPALTADEFHTHWREVHAAKVLSVPRIREWLVRYEQHDRVPADAASWTGSEGFDGMTLQWYASADDFMAMISDADYQRIVGPDEQHLIDLEHSVYLLTEQPRTILG